jgi:hypothetical protein
VRSRGRRGAQLCGGGDVVGDYIVFFRRDETGRAMFSRFRATKNERRFNQNTRLVRLSIIKDYGFQVFSSPIPENVARRLRRGWCATPNVALSWQSNTVDSRFFVTVLKQ